MNLLVRLITFPMLVVGLFSKNQICASLGPVELKVEFATHPLGIDVAQPRLSWKLTSDSRGDKQTAY
jgi:alpha-L-rhamnosidase